jgi:hypothetical protein
LDRQTVYPGQIPLETDLLNTNKNMMVALGFLAQDILGINTLVSGLACTPNSPAALNVLVAPGRIYSVQNMDATAYSSLAADLVHSLIKQGISLDTTTLACAAPGTVGYSVNYLIQAAFSEVDANPVALPYYNASNPAQPYSGPNNSGTAQNTTRKDTIVLTAKAGVAAATGSQTTPSADAGNVGLWVVTVAYGQTQIIAGNIAQVSGAPFITNTLTLLAPLLSPAFTGTPTAPTPATSDASTKLATTDFVNRLLLGAANFCVAGGTADALTGTIASNLTAPSDGMLVLVRASAANATTASTFNLTLGTTATGAKIVLKKNLQAIAVGDIPGAGAPCIFQYNAAYNSGAGAWVLLNPAAQQSTLTLEQILMYS